jgi:hypothetical protein
MHHFMFPAVNVLVDGLASILGLLEIFMPFFYREAAVYHEALLLLLIRYWKILES